MSRGPGRRIRQIQDRCRQQAIENRDDPEFWWVPMTSIPAETASESESIRRAAVTAERLGLIERCRPGWAARSRRGERFLADFLLELKDLGRDPQEIERVAATWGGYRGMDANWVRLRP